MTPRSQPRTHSWDHRLTRGGYLDQHDVEQRFMGRMAGRGGESAPISAQGHRAPGRRGAPEEPHTCPKPERALGNTRDTRPCPMLVGHPQARSSPCRISRAQIPSPKAALRGTPRSCPRLPGGFLKHVLCFPGEPRASCSQPGVPQQQGRAVPGDTSPSSSASPRDRGITGGRRLG